MLKIPVTILLILLVSVQTFSKWCLIIDYQVNKDYIAKNLCVNRSKPLSCCKGSCFLNKKLANDESQQQAPGKSAQRDESPLQVFTTEGFDPVSHAPMTLLLHSTRYLSGHSLEVSLLPFQPPRA